MVSPILELSNINKSFGHVHANKDINLTINKGTIHGIIGENGAGKSTLMRTIATLQAPDSGSIVFNDIDVLQDQLSLRKILGYLPQSFGVYPKMSAQELLNYFALLKGISVKKERDELVNELLDITNLQDVKKKNVDGYSGGMKQRFGIAQLLLNNPKLIIVDEPTAGLDPAERQRFLNVLREVGTNSTVIFSTHIVDDVKELCNDMAILNGGRILKHIKPADATKEIKNKIWTKIVKRDDLEKAESDYNILSSNYNVDNSLTIRVYSQKKPDKDFVKATPQLDDVYFIALKDDINN